MKVKCLAVDDEPLSLRIIQKYVADIQQLELIATASNALEAMQVLQQERIDLLFLDINMPKLSGIHLLKSLDRPPLVVFTTAYPEYAVEGFELEAVDYLLKPFSFDRFLKATNRAVKKLEPNPAGMDQKPGHLLVKADKKLFRIEYADILYLEAYGDYVKIHTPEKMLLTKNRLSIMQESLPDKQFYRIHRSFIVAVGAIEFIEGNTIKVGSAKLPVSQAYKDGLLERWAKGWG